MRINISGIIAQNFSTIPYVLDQNSVIKELAQIVSNVVAIVDKFANNLCFHHTFTDSGISSFIYSVNNYVVHVHKVDTFQLDILRNKGSLHLLGKSIILNEFFCEIIEGASKIHVDSIYHTPGARLIHFPRVPQGVLEKFI